jgi:hypothetical protein
MDISKIFRGQATSNTRPEGFIKQTVKPPGSALDSTTKTLLNRKGNTLYNQGDVEGARRIFLTTGYSDGISRVGDHYRKSGLVLKAYEMYRSAPNKRKAEEVLIAMAQVIKMTLRENGDN